MYLPLRNAIETYQILVISAGGVPMITAVPSQLSGSSSICRLDMRESVTVARSFGFRDMGDDSRGFVRAQCAVIVEMMLVTCLVGVHAPVVIDVFVDGSTIRLSGCGDGHG